VSSPLFGLLAQINIAADNPAPLRSAEPAPPSEAVGSARRSGALLSSLRNALARAFWVRNSGAAGIVV